MATETQVKNYLAHWFQLGRRIVSEPSGKTFQLASVISGDRFSPEFERCWENIVAEATHRPASDGAYVLEGTDQTVAELLSPSWDIAQCARCDMPVPMPEVVTASVVCPCHDDDSWPNLDLPQPRPPVNGRQRLAGIRDHLDTQS